MARITDDAWCWGGPWSQLCALVASIVEIPSQDSESTVALLARRKKQRIIASSPQGASVVVAVQFVAGVLSKGAVALRNPGAFGIRGSRGGRLDVVASDCRAAR